eukprot:1857941-Heterocapsa_arctica.AAC.1
MTQSLAAILGFPLRLEGLSSLGLPGFTPMSLGRISRGPLPGLPSLLPMIPTSSSVPSSPAPSSSMTMTSLFFHL